MSVSDLLAKVCGFSERDFLVLLRTLSPREEKIIKMRFGLEDGSNKTLEEVGQSFAVSRERIRQIEARALRKLRHPSRFDTIVPPRTVVQEVVYICSRCAARSKEDDMENDIDTWPLSVRAYNALKNNGIRTVGQLLEKSDAELLRFRNFGRVSLAEVRKVLSEGRTK